MPFEGHCWDHKQHFILNKKKPPLAINKNTNGGCVPHLVTVTSAPWTAAKDSEACPEECLEVCPEECHTECLELYLEVATTQARASWIPATQHLDANLWNKILPTRRNFLLLGMIHVLCIELTLDRCLITWSQHLKLHLVDAWLNILLF